MPGLQHDSSDSPPPSAMPSGDRVSARPNGASVRPVPWRANAWLFAATVASAFATYRSLYAREGAATLEAAQFTGALLAILLAHELGHFIAARIHKVDASLPYFLPLPLLSPFGTMGAVIRMRSVIPTRRALLDIGAAGPLAGLAFAIPLYAWGAAHSQVVSLDSAQGGMQLGSSLLLKLLDRFFAPPVPGGMDLLLSPVAFAAWGGMFVTMINLLPVSQLDGGHVAFALFGPRQNRIAMWVHRSMLVLFFVGVVSPTFRDLRVGLRLWHLGLHVQDSLFWLVWFEVLAILGTVTTARGQLVVGPTAMVLGPSSYGRLGVGTRAFAIVSLALLAGLFHESSSPLLWIAWFGGLGVLLTMEAKWGVLRSSSALLDHPPTGSARLSWGRSAVAIVTLLFFVMLFMPTPISM